MTRMTSEEYNLKSKRTKRKFTFYENAYHKREIPVPFDHLSFVSVFFLIKYPSVASLHSPSTKLYQFQFVIGFYLYR